MTYLAADGDAGVFTPAGGSAYDSPGEFKADLVSTSSGWTLTEHASGRVLHFNGSGRLVKSTDRDGNATRFSYDGSGNETQVEATRGPAAARTATVAYAANGNLHRYTQSAGAGRQVVYGYNSDGNLASIKLPGGRTTTFGYTGAGDLTSITTPTGATTTLAYDGQHRVLAVTRQAGTSSAATTRLAYPDSDTTLVADANTDQSQLVADVPHTTYTLNGTDRVTKATDPKGHSRSTSYTPFHDVATATNADGGTTTNSYGANNGESLTTSTSATGAAASIAYGTSPTQGNPTAAYQPSASTDTQGNTSAYSYNGPGNLASTSNATAAKASLTYNDDGTVATATDPKNDGNPTSYRYNDNYQLTKVTPPSGNSLGARSFTYDAYGRLETATDGAGHTLRYYYSTVDQVYKITNDTGGAVAMGYNGNGYLINRSDASGTTRWTYDDANRVLTRTTGGSEQTYRYDPVGNLTALTDGRGTTTYQYNTRNFLIAMTTAAGHRLTFAYNNDGYRTHTYYRRPVGSTDWTARTVVHYDHADRITRITAARGHDPNALVSDLSYCYAPHQSGQPCSTAASDDTGLRQWKTDHVAGTTSVYHYGKANRLTTATNVAGHDYAYGYDADGNRISTSVDGDQAQHLSFNSGNQITTSGYGYDGAGNLVHSPGGTLYDYNGYDQMTQVQPASVPATSYTYAGTDETELTHAGDTTFSYGIADQYNKPWIQSYTDTGQVSYIDRDGRGTPLVLTRNGHEYYYVTDGLGSIIGLVNATGDVSASYTYSPYGKTLSSTGGMATANLLRYASGLLDRTTSWTKFGARYYNPATGRFTQQDSLHRLGDPTNGNRYAYAACNPTNNTDPSGKCGAGQIFAAAWILVGGINLADAGANRNKLHRVWSKDELLYQAI